MANFYLPTAGKVFYSMEKSQRNPKKGHGCGFENYDANKMMMIIIIMATMIAMMIMTTMMIMTMMMINVTMMLISPTVTALLI